MKNKIPDVDLQKIREFLAEATGLDFPPPRWADLQRGIISAAKDLEFHTPAEFITRLMSGPLAKKELESLINHLTVGETYFFRERKTFEILAEKILPALIRARRNGNRQLRIWSAACCTGEEPYSIAILLRRILPDYQDWNLTILGTDINSQFLEKAAAGQFGKWSFRDAPPWLRGYFHTADEAHFQIHPEIKKMVRFARLNLADETYPLAENETSDMDVIFCRNVLMYFTESQARKVIQRLYRAQTEQGWLMVGPSELTNVSGIPYVAATGHGAVVYQKGKEPHPPRIIAPELVQFTPIETVEPLTVIVSEPARPAPADVLEKPQQSQQPTHGELAVSSANQGNLVDALDQCNQWIATDKLNASGHYLRAVILQEKGETEEAIRSLRNALYLDPNCVQAHFALGNIARNQGEFEEAARHLKNARELLSRFSSDDQLPEFEGVTAGRFIQIVDALIESEAA